MPTARLVDINTAAITYRTKCLMALDKRKYRNCIGAIIALNGLLPEDDEDNKYRIRIDSDEYSGKVRENYLIVCTHCLKELQYDSVKFFTINTSSLDRIVTGKDTIRIWICPGCKNENELEKSKIIESSLQKPYYLRVVPEPPKNTHGLLSKLDFHHKMEDWVWLCLAYLEEGFTKLREDNWNKADPYNELYEIDTNLEEAETV